MVAVAPQSRAVPMAWAAKPPAPRPEGAFPPRSLVAAAAGAASGVLIAAISAFSPLTRTDLPRIFVCPKRAPRPLSAPESSGQGVLAPPLQDLVGDVGDLHAEDERQSRGLDRLLVRVGDHPRVGDHGDVRQPVGGHELLDDREHGLGLALAALEGREHEREPVLPCQQADGYLRLETACRRSWSGCS